MLPWKYSNIRTDTHHLESFAMTDTVIQIDPEIQGGTPVFVGTHDDSGTVPN